MTNAHVRKRVKQEFAKKSTHVPYAESHAIYNNVRLALQFALRSVRTYSKHMGRTQERSIVLECVRAYAACVGGIDAVTVCVCVRRFN